MADRLKGKTVIITGAGQTPGETIGNGRAMAMLFTREGAEVLCVDRLLVRAEETVALVAGEGGKAFAHQADVSRNADCAAIIEAAKTRWGRLDVLVNNVGIGDGDGPVHRIGEAVWDRIMDVNLKATFMMTQHALAVMRPQKSGAIVNISSLAAIVGGSLVAYEVSKAAVNRLTTSTASAVAGQGIRCNAIMPGLMDTPMAITGTTAATGQTSQAVRESRDARVPLRGKMGTGWDTAYAALYFASDEAAFATGVVMPLDGGMSTRFG